MEAADLEEEPGSARASVLRREMSQRSFADPDGLSSGVATPSIRPGQITCRVPYLSKLESIASSAVRAADKVKAALIIVYTQSGQYRCPPLAFQLSSDLWGSLRVLLCNA